MPEFPAFRGWGADFAKAVRAAAFCTGRRSLPVGRRAAMGDDTAAEDEA